MNREVSENRIFLTKLFVLCGVIMGYDCWLNQPLLVVSVLPNR